MRGDLCHVGKDGADALIWAHYVKNASAHFRGKFHGSKCHGLWATSKFVHYFRGRLLHHSKPITFTEIWGMRIYIYFSRKGLQIRIGLQNRKHDAIQSAIKSSFLEWISNPGAIHQKGMQSGFCNPAIAILMMPDDTIVSALDIMEPPIVNMALKRLASFTCKQIITWVTASFKALQMLESRDPRLSGLLFPKLEKVRQRCFVQLQVQVQLFISFASAYCYLIFIIFSVTCDVFIPIISIIRKGKNIPHPKIATTPISLPITEQNHPTAVKTKYAPV